MTVLIESVGVVHQHRQHQSRRAEHHLSIPQIRALALPDPEGDATSTLRVAVVVLLTITKLCCQTGLITLIFKYTYYRAMHAMRRGCVTRIFSLFMPWLCAMSTQYGLLWCGGASATSSCC